MKTSIFHIIVGLSLISCVEQVKQNQEIPQVKESKNDTTEIVNKVYLCKGSRSYAYHLDPSCKGLSKCFSNVVVVSKEEAIDKEGRKLCGYED